MGKSDRTEDVTDEWALLAGCGRWRKAYVYIEWDGGDGDRVAVVEKKLETNGSMLTGRVVLWREAAEKGKRCEGKDMCAQMGGILRWE